MPMPKRVSLHSTGFSCHVRVEGSRNVRHVKRRLEAAGVEAEGPQHREGSAMYVFAVPYGSKVTHSKLARILTGTPGFSFYS
jgi:hypothetical protein